MGFKIQTRFFEKSLSVRYKRIVLTVMYYLSSSEKMFLHIINIILLHDATYNGKRERKRSINIV